MAEGSMTKEPDDILLALAQREVSEDQLTEVRTAWDSTPGSVVPILREWHRAEQLGENEYQYLLQQLLTIPVRSTISIEEIEPRFPGLIPISYARRHFLIGLAPAQGCMVIVAGDLPDAGILDHLGACLGVPTVLELAPREEIEKAIHHAYADQESDFTTVLSGIHLPAVDVDVSVSQEGDLLDNATRAPVVKLVNMILFEAVKRRASDVHIQPFESHAQARYRVDGVLYDFLEIPVHLLDEVVSRIKVVGRMDIAEKRIAQDGRTTVTVGDKIIDLRISIIPTSLGERAVLRLLDKSVRLYRLPELGMSEPDRVSFERLIQWPHGIILVTGPTGSGKSTTLYAALQYLDSKEKNILTLEDPIEYQLPGISQMQVSTKKGMTFATGLRAVLRQDPDVIMVGEIRDEETARMAVQSSLTGHLVFSTLHTNDAAGAVTRLLDLGIEPYLVASSLHASLAQRLIRLVCPDCCVDTAISKSEVQEHRLDAALEGRVVKSARGCESCAMTGYRGRRGVFELLCVDEAIRDFIVRRAKTSETEERAIANGMTTLRQDAVRKLLAGETTLQEVARLTQCGEQALAEVAEGMRPESQKVGRWGRLGLSDLTASEGQPGSFEA